MIENLRPIKGFPLYAIDIERGLIYSYRNGKQEVKGHTDARGVHRVGLIGNDGVRYFLRYNRVWYAARRGIDVRTIPCNLSVIVEDGELKLVNVSRLSEKANEALRERRRTTRMASLNQKKHEIEIMLRCYESGDHSEALRYMLTLRDNLSEWLRKHEYITIENARLYFDEAVEYMIARIDDPTSKITSLEEGLRCLMRRMKQWHGKQVAMDGYTEYLHVIKQ